MTKNEFLFVVATLFVIGALAFINFQSAEVKARDVQRKNDLKYVKAGLDGFFKDNGYYPKSQDGKIAACGDTNNFMPCEWGKDKLLNSPLSEDPLAPPKHYSYIYFSSGRNIQLFAHLERKEDAEYNESVARRGLSCGPVICNFGVANGSQRVDIELPAWVQPEATGSGALNEKK